MHRTISRLWFYYLGALDQGQLESLQAEMEGHTWIAEFLNQDNLVTYSQNQLLFHSIVQNSSGKIIGNAPEVFESFGLIVVPNQSYGQMDSLKLIDKIEQLKKETKALPISTKHEGIVLQLIDRSKN